MWIEIIKGPAAGTEGYVVREYERHYLIRVPHQEGWPWPDQTTVLKSICRKRPIIDDTTTEEAPF